MDQPAKGRRETGQDDREPDQAGGGDEQKPFDRRVARAGSAARPPSEWLMTMKRPRFRGLSK